MRIDAATLAQPVRENRRNTDVTAVFPSRGADKANAVALENRAVPAKFSAAEASVEKTGKSPEIPSGLLAAQSRFNAMQADAMNKGQQQAAEQIARNVSRYQGMAPPTGVDQQAASAGISVSA
jgi:hypothetical protein